MKKSLWIVLAIIILGGGGYAVYDFLQIKPLMVADVIHLESDNSRARMTIVSEENVLNTRDLGYFNWAQGEGWRDENKDVDGKRRPLALAVSTQFGQTAEQIVTITDTDGSFKIFLPTVPKESQDDNHWAWFYIDSAGSSYWGCNGTKTCNGGVIGSERALREEHLARRAD